MNDKNVSNLWTQIFHSIDSIKLVLQNSDTQKMLAKDLDTLKNNTRVRRTFDLLGFEASRIVKFLDSLENVGAITRQDRWTDPIKENEQKSLTLGSYANVYFPYLGKTIKGKVDTGATTSSLHGTNVNIEKKQGTVSFICCALSDNIISLPLKGTQEVHSADGGSELRPVVSLDIKINGIPLKNIEFNINDRSNMDVPLLIGQNILKAGEFVVDVKDTNIKETENASSTIQNQTPTIDEAKNAAILILTFLNASNNSPPESMPK